MSATAPVTEGTLLWEPSSERVAASRLSAFAAWLEREVGRRFATYEELWDFSVTELDSFWRLLATYFDVRFHTPPRAVLEGAMPAAHWFPGATLNYAEHALRAADDAPALVFRAEDGRRQTRTFGELRAEVACLRTGLAKLGVQRGDRVAALLPNRPETVALFLATVSLGAIFSSCSPEFGAASILDRFRQIEPKVFVTVDGYRYGGKTFDRSADVRAIAEALPYATLVVLPELGGDVGTPALAFPSSLGNKVHSRSSPCPSNIRSGSSIRRVRRAC